MDLVSQNLLMTSGGKQDPTYVDDVFSTYLYYGNCPDNNLNTTQTITNGIDLAGEGGLVWLKHRTGLLGSAPHALVDTERGVNKTIYSNSSQAQDAYDDVNAFNSNGFQLKGQGNAGCSNYGQGSTTTAKYSSWTFRKQKGFFDVVKYTGGSGTQTISHNLGCLPGMIIVKALDSSDNWAVFHRDMDATNPNNYAMKLNTTDGRFTGAGWNVTATTFDAAFSLTNNDGADFIAYLFAGGESNAATARSVDIDDDDGLNVAASSDFNFGTGQFCIECWVYVDDLPGSGSPSYGRVFQLDGPTGNSAFSNLQVTINPSNGTLHAWANGGGNPVAIVGSKNLKDGQWHHIAVNRDSNNLITQYVDGIPDGTVTTATNFNPNSGSPRPRIGIYDTGGTNGVFNGKISNLRVTVGEPVYTSAFRPSTTPLTTSSQGVTASNVKLLCCNNSSTTGSTTTSGTITANGDPTASTDSPFDDPAGFKFGEEGDQNIIKTGSYIGNGSSSAPPSIYLGWEPQWVMVKHTTGQDWVMVDSMRGMYRGESTMPHLRANSTNLEQDTSYYRIDVSSSTGFAPFTTDNGLNDNGGKYVYIALRRPDGYVGKPVEVGSNLFAMDTGNASSSIPNFDSGFPVDFAFMKTPASSGDWYTGARILGERYVRTNSGNVEADWGGGFDWDSNVGWLKSSATSAWQSWMWKRHAGFDVVCYEGLGFAGQQVPHNLSKVPEMMWVKRRDGANRDWQVYHQGLNGGTNPEQYKVILNSNAAESLTTTAWASTAPTSRHISLGHSSDVNLASTNYIAMLFASVDGISKVGSYTGNGSASGPIVTLGFSPRFILIKCTTGGTNWYLYDTLRGLESGNDKRLQLNSSSGQDTADDMDPSATGFQVVSTWDQLNGNTQNYLYYAHA